VVAELHSAGGTDLKGIASQALHAGLKGIASQVVHAQVLHAA